MWTIHYSVLFFSLKLPKLHYLNLFICFNNILKKISFSCYIKSNTSHFNEEIYISLRKRIFQCFFPFISMFWMKINEKARNILTFHGNSFFSLKIPWIIPFPAFLGELTSYLRKTIFISDQKRRIYATSRKNVFSPKKLIFWWFSAYFIVFIKQ